ncbi:MAG: class I SAM-dependent methyltransferase [Gammaproteobacteria bacterium]|nr:class I SAM-dependent methyltransferase [Gammaproteobacteria bacterium]
MNKSTVAPESAETIRFEFGKNWQAFLTEFDHDRLETSRKHLLDTLQLEDLQGKDFVDIGCGSGLHSLAAYFSGARQIISFDFDPDSVEATKSLRERAGHPENWKIIEGSVLDRDFMSSLPKGDIVYSWGVLHHTGDLWNAVNNSIIPLKDDGVYYIALYADEVYQNPSPQYWIDIKLKYNRAGPEEKKEMENWYAWERVLKGRAMQGENPFTIIDEYNKSRGMEFWTDVRDWLGGYPIEFSTSSDVARFCYERGLNIVNINSGHGNTEFVMTKQAISPENDYFVEEIPITRPFILEDGACYKTHLPEQIAIANTSDNKTRSPLMLFEDGALIGFPHAPLTAIKDKGEGRFNHTGEYLYFSSSDNSDPNINNKIYTLWRRKQR